MRKYPEDYCLADIAAYGACILTPNHPGDHKDANGYSFSGKDKKVRIVAVRTESDDCERLTPGCCIDHTAESKRDRTDESPCETW